jgi:branched-chain amino acid transport system ATP-binding protein
VNGTASALVIDNLSAGYGDTQVLWDVSLRVEPGEIVALIGSNGAGKSTLLDAVSGIVNTWSGEVRYGSAAMSGLEPDRVVSAGVVQVPQGRRLFGSLSVEDNLRMGAYLRRDREIDADLEGILAMLPRLRERYDYLAGRLSGGEQQQVAIGRALMARPKMILMDEPSMGLSPLLVKEVFAIIKEINRDLGVTILLVEQNARAALSVASHGYIMEQGKVVLDGSADELRDNEDVKEFYLGGAGDQRKSFKNLKSFKRRKRWL